MGCGPAQSPSRCTKYNTHQRPVYQLHIIRCGTVIASTLQRVNFPRYRGQKDVDACSSRFFLSRDAMYSAACRALKVRLSITFVYYIETAKRILKLFSPSGIQTILVFFTQDVAISLYDAALKSCLQVGYEKIAIFDQYLALSLKRYKIDP